MSNGELYVQKLLLNANIEFEQEKIFPNLKRKGFLRFDFYCPNIEGAPVIIEYDGEYHWKPIRGIDALKKQKEYDRIKNSYCLAKGIKLIRIPYWELKNLTLPEILKNQNFIVKSKWHNDRLRRKD